MTKFEVQALRLLLMLAEDPAALSERPALRVAYQEARDAWYAAACVDASLSPPHRGGGDAPYFGGGRG